MLETRSDVWITGVGIVSSQGEGVAAHHGLDGAGGTRAPKIDQTTFAPFAVHPLAQVDFSKQITKNSDLRQMEGWQRLGVYAAGLALEDAGLKGNAAILDHTDLVVAAGSGERDVTVDCRVLEATTAAASTGLLPNEVLPTALRPTLFLAQLSNLLAGNISIIHKVTGSSRTFMGEEMAGLSAIENAFKRVAARQSRLCLVGGALNAERADLLLGYEIGHNLWTGEHRPIRERLGHGGGFVPGSVGAFLVFEAREHAEARQAKPYARIGGVATDRSRREPGDVERTLKMLHAAASQNAGDGAAPRIYCGASGVEPSSGEELAFVDGLAKGGAAPWLYGDVLGHGVEAQFPAGVALAAIAIGAATRGSGPPGPDRVLVTGTGHWRGEGMALVASVQGRTA